MSRTMSLGNLLQNISGPEEREQLGLIPAPGDDEETTLEVSDCDVAAVERLRFVFGVGNADSDRPRCSVAHEVVARICSGSLTGYGESAAEIAEHCAAAEEGAAELCADATLVLSLAQRCKDAEARAVEMQREISRLRLACATRQWKGFADEIASEESQMVSPVSSPSDVPTRSSTSSPMAALVPGSMQWADAQASAMKAKSTTVDRLARNAADVRRAFNEKRDKWQDKEAQEFELKLQNERPLQRVLNSRKVEEKVDDGVWRRSDGLATLALLHPNAVAETRSPGILGKMVDKFSHTMSDLYSPSSTADVKIKRSSSATGISRAPAQTGPAAHFAKVGAPRRSRSEGGDMKQTRSTSEG